MTSSPRKRPTGLPLEIDRFVHGRGGIFPDTLSDTTRAGLASIARIKEVARGECVLAEGADVEELGYLLDGAMAMEKRLGDGRKHIIGLLVPTDMFGRLFDGGNPYDIVALTDCRILSFERTRFEEILYDCPELEKTFMHSILDELDTAREWVLLIGARKVSERIAAFLLLLLRRTQVTPVEEDGGENPPLLRIPITRRDLAHYLGTTSETISRVLRQFEQKGVILRRASNAFHVLDEAALVRMAGTDLLAPDV